VAEKDNCHTFLKESIMITNLLLVDGDEITYQAAHASQTVLYHVLDENESEVVSFPYKKEAELFIKDYPAYTLNRVVYPAEEKIAYSNVRAIIKEMVENTGINNYSLYLSDPINNFRDALATLTPYKGDRENLERPFHYHNIRRYIEEEEFGTVASNQEADDALGIMQYNYNSEGKYLPVIISQDKDLRMIAGYYYDRKTKTKHFISQEQADKRFFHQLLVGDSTDCIPGIYRMGFVTAERVLLPYTSNQDTLKAVIEQYQKAITNGKFKYETSLSVEEIVLEIGRLLWIRRKSDQLWDFNTLQ
jgi:hypothetical protein